MKPSRQNIPRVLIASKREDAPGIYSANWDPSIGEMEGLRFAAAIEGPSFLAHSFCNDGDLLLVVGQSTTDGGYIAAYRYEPESGELSFLNRESTLGKDPVHLCIHPDGRSVYAVNYWEAGISSFVIGSDGRLSSAVSHFRYKGRGPKNPRQDEPHAHGVTISSDGRFLFVNDLGLDRIRLYRTEATTAKLVEHDPSFWASEPEAGPRHSTFHPNGRWLYSIQELDSTVVALEWNQNRGLLTSFAAVSLLPSEHLPEHARACEIVVSPDGRFVYASNRGSDLLSVLRVDPVDGAITLMQQTSTGGENARHIALDPSGRWMLVCNESSRAIAVLKRDSSDGTLSAPLSTVTLDLPVCALFR